MGVWWMFWRRLAVIGSLTFSGTAAAEGKWVAFALFALIGVGNSPSWNQDNSERRAVGGVEEGRPRAC